MRPDRTNDIKLEHERLLETIEAIMPDTDEGLREDFLYSLLTLIGLMSEHGHDLGFTE